MRLPLTVILILLALSCFSQKKNLNRELMIENDNDAYTLNLTRDQYYSNGVALRYRLLTDSAKWGPSLKKSIRTFQINHRIFSPKHLWWTDSADLDRPYAGQMSVAYSQEYYFKNQSYLLVRGELGWMGPSLRIAQLQYEWHKLFGMTLPQAWRYQINDGIILNGYGTYARQLVQEESLDIISESNIAFGSSFGHLRQEIMFRIGTRRLLNNSTQYNALVGTPNNGPGNHEFYFFISPGIEYVFLNATIEGNPIGMESIFTKELVNWVYQTRAGVMASWTKFDFGLIYYRRTKETSESTYHKYIGILMNQRF